ncbi:MAG: hypothetical protein GTO18_15245 [Anaerolineales bacterium]|nr:hypothetical protein [Anaerolineales bacterium]
MFKLYLLKGSRHSEDAYRLLSDTNLEFEAESISGREELASIYFDLGIRELPTLISESSRAEGLDEIQAFLKRST